MSEQLQLPSQYGKHIITTLQPGKKKACPPCSQESLAKQAYLEQEENTETSSLLLKRKLDMLDDTIEYDFGISAANRQKHNSFFGRIWEKLQAWFLGKEKGSKKPFNRF